MTSTGREAIPGGGTGAFSVSAQAYDGFMGRYSGPLAVLFADAAGVEPGQAALDVGCGPGALTGVLGDRLGAAAVAACDPSPLFVTACAARHPGVDVRVGSAEALPWGDDSFDRVLSSLVLHFVGDPAAAAAEFVRVLRPGGVVAASVWDVAQGMQLLRHFWDAALAVDPGAPDEARTLRFGRRDEIAALWRDAGLVDVEEAILEVASTYTDFDEVWAGFEAGVGPAGSYCAGLPRAQAAAVRADMFRRIGSPAAAFTLTATARCARGRAPG